LNITEKAIAVPEIHAPLFRKCGRHGSIDRDVPCAIIKYTAIQYRRIRAGAPAGMMKNAGN